MRFESKQRVVKDLLVNYYVRVKPGKRALLFLHGWRSEAALWLPVLEKWKHEDASIYCLDLPGFGGSELPLTPYAVGDYADFVARFIAELKLAHVVVIGHSFGGRVAIKLAAGEPKFLKGIVLVDSAGFAETTKMKQVKRIVARILRPVFRRDALKDLRRYIYRMMGAEDYVATPELRETYLKAISEDLSYDMTRVTAPVGIIWGERDKDAPLSWGRRMKDLMPHATLTILKDAGHFAFLDDQRGFIAALEKQIGDM